VLRTTPDALELSCAGRTDAGIHAWGQVVSLPVANGAAVEPDKVARAVNSQLGPEVVVREADWAVPGFDARHSATWRSYRYTVVNRPVPDPFLARTAWWVREPLDLRVLRMAGDPILGGTTSRVLSQGPRVDHRAPGLDSTWYDLGDGVLRYAFAPPRSWQMGVDRGPSSTSACRPPEDCASARRDRNADGCSPPGGLTLWQIGYADPPRPSMRRCAGPGLATHAREGALGAGWGRGDEFVVRVDHAQRRISASGRCTSTSARARRCSPVSPTTPIPIGGRCS
jgi:tRNA pseudouridine38-40 synthase